MDADFNYLFIYIYIIYVVITVNYCKWLVLYYSVILVIRPKFDFPYRCNPR